MGEEIRDPKMAPDPKGHKETRSKPETEKTEMEEEERPEIEHLSYEQLENKLTHFEQLATENWNKLLRVQADLQNMERIKKRDVEEAYKFSNEKLISELLLAKDSLEQGLVQEGSSQENMEHMRQGMELTLKILTKAMEKFGVIELNPQGELFDPAYHEAMLTQESKDVRPNHVLQVLQKGYLLHDRLLRAARVVVAKEK
jgi:molecular chaperone GrpE